MVYIHRCTCTVTTPKHFGSKIMQSKPKIHVDLTHPILGQKACGKTAWRVGFLTISDEYFPLLRVHELADILAQRHARTVDVRKFTHFLKACLFFSRTRTDNHCTFEGETSRNSSKYCKVINILHSVLTFKQEKPNGKSPTPNTWSWSWHLTLDRDPDTGSIHVD